MDATMLIAIADQRCLAWQRHLTEPACDHVPVHGLSRWTDAIRRASPGAADSGSAPVPHRSLPPRCPAGTEAAVSGPDRVEGLHARGDVIVDMAVVEPGAHSV